MVFEKILKTQHRNTRNDTPQQRNMISPIPVHEIIKVYPDAKISH